MQRTEVWLITLDPTVDAEIKKTRPVAILSSDDVGTLPLKIVAPLTDWKEHYADVPWLVLVNPSQQNGLAKPSACDTFQLRSVSVERFIRRLGSLDARTMQSISRALAEMLEIE
jgi:mRNA interferase MazF